MFFEQKGINNTLLLQDKFGQGAHRWRGQVVVDCARSRCQCRDSDADTDHTYNLSAVADGGQRVTPAKSSIAL